MVSLTTKTSGEQGAPRNLTCGRRVPQSDGSAAAAADFHDTLLAKQTRSGKECVGSERQAGSTHLRGDAQRGRGLAEERGAANFANEFTLRARVRQWRAML